MSLISVSIINVALPSIQRGLGADETDMQWVLSGYALTFGVVLVAAGRAGDLLGRGGMFLLGIVIYTASSVVAGVAPNAEMLNTARFIQGVGAGFLNPQGVGMIQQYFRGTERGRAFGFFGSTVGVAVAIGPVLGGLLIKLGGPELGWRLTFLVNLPFGILAIVLGLLWFPRPLLARIRSEETGRPIGALKTVASLDPFGALLLGLAVLAVMIPFMEAGGSAWFWALLPLAALLLFAWARWERRVEAKGNAPMVNLDVFHHSSFRNGSLLAMLWFGGITSIWVLVALYFQNALGHSALVAGTIGVPAALLSALSANWAGKHVIAKGRSIVIGGMVLVLVGLSLTIALIWAVERFGIPEWWLIASLAIVGCAQGTVISPNQTLTLADVPTEYAGASGAILQTGQRIGTSIGLTVVTAVTFGVLASHSWTTSLIAGFATIIGICCTSLAVGIVDLRTRTASSTRTETVS